MVLIEERRRFQRRPCLADARLWHEGGAAAVRAVALDISEDGARLALLDPFEAEGRLEVCFVGRRGGASPMIPASIAHTAERHGAGGKPPVTMGISFIKRQSRLADLLGIAHD